VTISTVEDFNNGVAVRSGLHLLPLGESPVNRRSRIAAIAIAIALVISFGCSSSDNDAATDASAPDTTVAGGNGSSGPLNDLCVEGNAAIAAAAADIGAAISGLRDATNGDEFAAGLADAETAAGETAAAIEDFRTAIEEFEASDDLSAAIADYTEALDAKLAAANDVEAMVSSDSEDTETLDALRAALAPLQEADAAANDALAEAATALDTDGCAPAGVDAPGTTEATNGTEPTEG